jgi:ADP-ribosylglycohydrolase
MAALSFNERIEGLLIGTAVGDALGLPAEGLSRARIQRRWRDGWRMRLVLGRGMVSDDTEHAVMVAQSLLSCSNDAVKFRQRLGWKLRWWLLPLPAGVGFATARAILRLWCGIPASHSGVRSAGNGPAMRVAAIGSFFAWDAERRREFTKAATRLTHTDERAEIAARAVVEASAWITRQEKPLEEFLPALFELSSNEEWQGICDKVAQAQSAKLSVEAFADSLGLKSGVTGYAFHTVPVALYSCLRHPKDFREALSAVLSCGGDTDTVGAIVGALMGAAVGKSNIPSEWRNGIIEWPRSLRFLERLAGRIADVAQGRTDATEMPFFWPGLLPRNLLFLGIVLGHGFRRLLPPY